MLSNIPFFCVGLTAFAVFAFFLVMRRMNLCVVCPGTILSELTHRSPAVYLYTSSLLAFGASCRPFRAVRLLIHTPSVAAILDLSQVLLRGTTNTDQGLGLNTVIGIVDTREVLLALSFGFRYLYLWAFVAQRPRYEPRPRSQVDPLFSETYFHSASWERWGVPGLVLKFALLGSVISIPILQITWRIATGFSAVYIAEATVQIAVSVLFIAKLMLNLFLSTVAPWWRPFIPYIIPIMALMISTGIGAGNLLLCECKLITSESDVHDLCSQVLRNHPRPIHAGCGNLQSHALSPHLHVLQRPAICPTQCSYSSEKKLVLH